MSQPWFPFLYDQVFKITDILDSYFVLLDISAIKTEPKMWNELNLNDWQKAPAENNFTGHSTCQSNNQTINQACEYWLFKLGKHYKLKTSFISW